MGWGWRGKTPEGYFAMPPGAGVARGEGYPPPSGQVVVMSPPRSRIVRHGYHVTVVVVVLNGLTT